MIGSLAAACTIAGAMAGAVVFALLIVVVEHYQGACDAGVDALSYRREPRTLYRPTPSL